MKVSVSVRGRVKVTAEKKAGNIHRSDRDPEHEPAAAVLACFTREPRAHRKADRRLEFVHFHSLYKDTRHEKTSTKKCRGARDG